MRDEEKRKKYIKIYREKNKKEIAKQTKEYRTRKSDFLKKRKKEYYQNNKEEINLKNKNYNQCNKEEINLYKKEWYLKNKNKIKNRQNFLLNQFCIYDDWCKKINKYYECRRDPNNSELIQVRCKYCNNWFNPTFLMLKNRYNVILGNIAGVFELYCSSGCKMACPIYKQLKYPKNFKPATSREVQPELRKIVLERDQWTCQKCNKNKSEFSDLELHCHHIDPVVNNPIESADVDNCITLCKECHKEVHKNTPGCGYNELQCK